MTKFDLTQIEPESFKGKTTIPFERYREKKNGLKALVLFYLTLALCWIIGG